ncbi:MAG: helix-turn-helix domain-containing protein [Pseudomonadota bacterium]|uniref:MarR family winged helix-turn-helix transcriptional regulator n=1 Tax=Sphingomonas sp. ERG5 TaxID=1381597 RepID=UPI00054C12AA|nr:helix-turn-helix domain-containing protein [Sphingomonas sp. ERG5]
MENDDFRTPSGKAISELIVTVFRLNGRLLAAGDRLVAELGLTSARWQVLGAIALSPVPEPVARLARNMGLNRQGVQRIVSELVAEGFAELKENPHHRSAKLVVMTSKGLHAYDCALRAQAPWVNMLGDKVDPEGIQRASKVLEGLRQRLEQPSSEKANT